MAQKISLALHRNTVESRRKREMATHVQKQVERVIRENDIRAYAFVGIGSDGRAHALWDTGAILPMWAFPSTIHEVLASDMQSSGVTEDWKPSLTLKGSQ